MAKLSEFHGTRSLQIEAVASWTKTQLQFSFALLGDIAGISFPNAGAHPERRDELWRHTCFEAFLQPLGQDAYFEFNFSPAGDWNVYAFDDYREGMRAVNRVAQLERFEFSAKGLEARLECAVDLAGLNLPPSGFRLGLSAIIESAQGETSYWALQHPADKPDFHNAKGFSLELAAPPIRN